MKDRIKKRKLTTASTSVPLPPFHRFHRFLLWLGTPLLMTHEIKVQQVCSVISEFALEYRTCRERVLQQIQKKAAHRERNKTRGKMISEVRKRGKRGKRTKRKGKE